MDCVEMETQDERKMRIKNKKNDGEKQEVKSRYIIHQKAKTVSIRVSLRNFIKIDIEDLPLAADSSLFRALKPY
jgi:hypothetical protein